MSQERDALQVSQTAEHILPLCHAWQQSKLYLHAWGVGSCSYQEKKKKTAQNSDRTQYNKQTAHGMYYVPTYLKKESVASQCCFHAIFAFCPRRTSCCSFFPCVITRMYFRTQDTFAITHMLSIICSFTFSWGEHGKHFWNCIKGTCWCILLCVRKQCLRTSFRPTLPPKYMANGLWSH